MGKKDKFIFILGVLVIIIPFLGIPGDTKNIIMSLFGVVFVFTAYFLQDTHFSLSRRNEEKTTPTFMENKESFEDEHK